jgi:PAS domain-containing protein
VDWLVRLKGFRDSVFQGPWALRFGGIFALLVLGTFLAPFGGVLSQILRTSDVAEQLAVDRAKALVLALDKRNMRPLAKGEQLGFDAEFVIIELGVKAALVTDDRGVVRAPSDKVRSSISNKAYFNRARELGRVYAEKEEGLWHVLKPIRAARVEGGPQDVVGWAYIMYDANEVVDSYISNYARLIVALLLLLLLGGSCGWMAYRMASRPIVNLREELELAMRGHVSSVVCDARWGDLDALAHSTNRLLQRWQQGGGESTKIPPILAAAMETVPVPALITTANGTVLSLNRAAASWLRKDPASVVGNSITTLIPDAAFATMLQGVCGAARQSPDGLARDRVVLSSYALTTVASTDGPGVIALTTAGE